MKKFSQAVLEAKKDGRTPAIFDRIKDELKAMFDEQARMLEEKLNEIGFEISRPHVSVTRKVGPKWDSGVRVYFKDKNDIEYVLRDNLNNMEFELYTVRIEKDRAVEDVLVSKTLYFESTLKPLKEKLVGKRTLGLYFDNTETGEGGHAETIDVSDLFMEEDDITISIFAKELKHRIRPLFKPTDDTFMSDHFVFKGKEYSLIGSPGSFNVLDAKDDDALDERGLKLPRFNF